MLFVLGCGKTCAVETCATDLSITVKQWTNQHTDFQPYQATERGDNYVEYQSQARLFDSFLLRANK